MKKYLAMLVLILPFVFSATVNGFELGNDYICGVCGYNYVPKNGDQKGEVQPGTPFANLPENWKCPVCGSAKSKFKEKTPQ